MPKVLACPERYTALPAGPRPDPPPVFRTGLICTQLTSAARLCRAGLTESLLTCGFALERVTRIELALSAWESVPSRLLCPLTCGDGPSVNDRERPLVTRLMAR
jgi:hypothetical protein